MEKTCKKCAVSKPLSEFYKHAGMSDGHLNVCKDCYKSGVKQNREKNIEYYKAYDNARANRPDRVEARRKYSETEAGKRAGAAAKARYIEKNPIKRAAHMMVGNAIQSGSLVRQPCAVCGSLRVHAHHDDYARPLDVTWLCQEHHAEWHRQNSPMFNGVTLEDAA